jgi:hypothetical protein
MSALTPSSTAPTGSFGRYLLTKGLLERHELEEATQVMVVFGGRLGTILVESGLLTLEEVEKHLSAYLDVPCAPRERLAAPDPKALAKIPREVAKRHSVLPLWIEKRTLHLAMLDARDPNRIDEIAFATDLKIVPYVVGERRLVELLERHYEIRPDPRFTDHRILEMAGHYRSVRRRLDGLEPGQAGGATTCASSDSSKALDELERERAALGIAPLGDDEELSDPQECGLPDPAGAGARLAEPIELTEEAAQPKPSTRSPAEAHAPSEAPRLEPARDPAEVARLEADLIFLAARDRIVPLALRIATHYVRAAAVFLVRDPLIQGMLAAGDVRTEHIDGVLLPLASESMLSRAAGPDGRFRGPAAREGIDAEVLRVLRERAPKESAVLPVRLGDRPVHLLYVDNGPDPLAETSLAALDALCDLVSVAYERLVLDGKRRLG